MTRIPGDSIIWRVIDLKITAFRREGERGGVRLARVRSSRRTSVSLAAIELDLRTEPRNRVPRAERAELWTAVIDAGDFDSRTRRHQRRFNTLAFHVQRPRRATPPAAADDFFFFFYVTAVVRAIYPYGRHHNGLARARHRHTGTWRVVPGCPAAGTVDRRGNYPTVAVHFSTEEGISHLFRRYIIDFRNCRRWETDDAKLSLLGHRR